MIDFSKLGYNKPLFILPFDHRTSFIKGIFGDEVKEINNDQKQRIIEEKQIIYEAFKKAVLEKIPKEEAAILVDEEFGDSILQDAVKNSFNTCLTTEKSGQEIFDFEYKDNFSEHIKKYNPKFVKALIRYNPEGEIEVNKKQEEKLRILNDFCHNEGYLFLLEVLIPPTKEQLENSGGNLLEFEEKIKPELTLKMINLLRRANIEPDVWKLEGLNSQNDYEKICLKIKEGNRENVSMVILGRGERKELVDEWIIQGAKEKGVIGFAIGRTIFWKPLEDYRNKNLTKEETIDIISSNYQYYYQLFIDNKNI